MVSAFIYSGSMNFTTGVADLNVVLRFVNAQSSSSWSPIQTELRLCDIHSSQAHCAVGSHIPSIKLKVSRKSS